MNILLLAQHYAPEEVSGAALATGLATGLAQRGHQVTFVTAAPSYPQGRVFPGYRNALYQSEMLADVRVIRAWSFITPRKSFWPRFFNYASFSLSTFMASLRAGRPDVMLSYSPPLPLGLSAWALSRVWRVPWALRVEDIFPDAAVAAGVLRSGWAIRLFSGLERFLYRRAHNISVPSQSFVENLSAKGVPESKLSLIPVWADAQEIIPLPKENSFRQEQGLNGKFVVLYAGNMGYTASLEEVIQAANQLRRYPSIHFLMVGEGVCKPALQKMAQDYGIENIRFLPYQPRASLPEMLAAADLCLVTLNPASADFSMPNKMFSSMASGRPILAVAPVQSDLARITLETRCGQVAPPGQPQRLAEVILSLEKDRRALDEMGRRGRARLEAEFSGEHCIQAFDALLRGMALD